MQKQSQTVLVVAPHPDDETLGVGATLLKHHKNGDRLFWLIMTSVTDDSNFTAEFRTKRTQEIKEVSRMYGFQKTLELPFRPTRLDTYPRGDLVSSVSKVIQEVKPDTLYIPNRSDVHTDHRITFEVMMACSKSFRYPFLKRVLMYETPSETDAVPPSREEAFIPNVFVDVEEFFEQKIKIMSLYTSEVGKHPFPRSPETLRALAAYRGSLAHMKQAEAFCLLKELC